MTRPIVSVNMCMYNSARYIAETLRSVFAQTLQDFELVIVDDGSTDGSPELVKEQFPDSRVVVVHQRHLTLRVARSVALANSSGDYIAFLDTDDLWAPTKLEQQLAAARADPDAGLIFADCGLIDASSRSLGQRFSDQFDYRAMNLRGTHSHLELLQRGNFVAPPTPLVPTAVIRALGGFNHEYRHVNDYEMWLRIARHHPFAFVDDVLAQYRVHDTQFSQTRPEVTLPEQCALLEQILWSSSYPPSIRTAIGDNLLGQHRWAWRALWKQRRYWLAIRAALDMRRYPDRLRDSVRHRLAQSFVGQPFDATIAAWYRGKSILHRGKSILLEAKDVVARARAYAMNELRRTAQRARRLVRVVRGQEPFPRARRTRTPIPVVPPPAIDVWIDGTSLGQAQTGYFSLLTGLIRRLATDDQLRCAVHVFTDAAGRAALRSRLGSDTTLVRFHRIGWRAMHWAQLHALLVSWPLQLLVALAALAAIAIGLGTSTPLITSVGGVVGLAQAALLLDELTAGLTEMLSRPRRRWSARLVRFLWRRFPAPRWAAPTPNTVEILFWRGRFKWRNSRRIAVVQDMTTRIHPELHTPGNILEFEEFLVYVQRHAHAILTVSENSRRDVIDRMMVCPEAVSVIPMPVHPQYVNPEFRRGVVTLHRIDTPYVLSVGTIEPRKNLRRLVRAFELLKEEDAAKDLVVVLVGPQGWDPAFQEILLATDAAPRIRLAGFVPLDHLPSLYHYASAVICPSVYEGFGIPVLEAMCSSGVVLASRVSSLPEVLGADGILFDPYDSQDIARALLGAIAMTPADQASYRRRCRQRAEAHLDRIVRTHPLGDMGLPAAADLRR